MMGLIRIFEAIERFQSALPCTADQAKKSLNALVDVLGADFFADVQMTKDVFTQKPVIKHPLLRLLYSNVPLGITLGISDVLDLTDSLNKLANVKNIDETLVLLKNDKQYQSSAFQIEQAAHFRDNGWEVIEMEPISKYGKADILLDSNLGLMSCECYRMNLGLSDKGLPLYYQLFIDHLFEAVSGISPKFIEMWIRELPPVEVLHRILRWCANNISKTEGDEGGAIQFKYKNTRVKIEALSIEVEDPHLEYNGERCQFKEGVQRDFAATESFTGAKNPAQDLKKPRYLGKMPNRLIVHGYSISDVQAEIRQRMLKTFGRKVKQSIMDDKAIVSGLFVSVPYGMYHNIESDPDVQTIVNKTAERYPELKTLHLCVRKINYDTGRHYYERHEMLK